MTLRELWFTAPGAVELRPGASASLEPGQLRLRALASGISQGTELLLYSGQGPTPFDPSLDAPGAPTYPRRYGYAWVGEVVEAREADQAVGKRVFALAPHGDEHCLDAARVRPLPDDVPAERATLAANLETAINVVWDAGIALGDDVIVLGGGVVGALSGHLAKRGGAARVRLLEPHAARRATALQLGFDEALPPEALPVAAADVVLEASGDPASLARAMRLVRDEGVIVVASFYGQRQAVVPLGSDFHRRRLSLKASQVSRLPPQKLAGWSYDRRFELVTECLKNPRLDALLGSPVAFGEAAATYARLSHGPSATLQTVFHYAR